MTDRKLFIVTGHYGSGKTEFSVNLAIKLKKEYEHVSIGDLDIVNTYFRTREKTDELESLGIHVCDSSIRNTTLDLPALSPEIMGIIKDQNVTSVLDVGGDPVGARVLARFSPLIRSQQYELLFVLNANRPETQTLENAINYFKAIEITSQLKISGIINSTHLLKATTVDDIVRGHELAKQLSEEMNVPIKYDVAIEPVAKIIEDEEIKKTLFPINMYMRSEWMS